MKASKAAKVARTRSPLGTAPVERAEPRPDPQWWGYPVAVVLAPLVFFADGILGRVVYAFGDGIELFVPWFMVSARAWRSGHLPTWNPWAQAGMPHLGASQAGALYLPNLLWLVASPAVANNAGLVATFLVAGLGAWMLARLVCGDDVAAAVGGLGFGLCTFLFAHIGHESMIAGAAWLPWMLYGYERLRRRFTPAGLLALAAFIALALLAGHTQIFFVDLLVLGVYAAGVTLLGRPSRPGRSAALAVLAVAAGVGLGAVQLFPTIVVARASVRTTMSFSGAMTYSIPPSHAPLLLFPYLFGTGVTSHLYTPAYGGLWNLTELSGYPGAAILVLASAGLVAMRRRREARALAAVTVVCLALAFGPATPLSRLIYRLPVYGEFRAWGRYVLGFDLGMAMLAAYGVAVLRRGKAAERRKAGILALLAAAAVLAAAVLLPHFDALRRFVPGGRPAAAALLVPCAATAAGAACVFLLRRARRIGALTAVVVVSLDAFFSFAGSYQWRAWSPTPAQFAAALSPRTPFSWGQVAANPGGIGRYLYLGADIAPAGWELVHVSDAKGMRSVNANDALVNTDFAAAVGMTPWGSAVYTGDLWRPASRVLDLLRVTTVVVDPGSSGGGPPAGSLLTGGAPVMGGRLVRYERTPRLPDAFLAGTVQRRSFAEAVDAIHGVQPFDPSATAIVDAPCHACPDGPPGAAGSVSKVHWGINSVSVTADATRPAMLVVSQAWSPGWQARVDGRTVPAVRVDGLVQGVPVPAGARRVELFYRAPGLRLGFGVSLATLAALLVGIAVKAVAGTPSEAPATGKSPWPSGRSR